MNKEYAKVVWRVEDVQTLRPDMSDEDAQTWIETNAKYIQERLIELGWDVMEDLLP